MDHIQELQRKHQERVDHIKSTFSTTTNVETLGEITSEQLSSLEKAKKVSVFTPEAVKQMEIDLNKAEDTGFWKGEKVDKGDVSDAKKAVEKLQKKVVTDKNGGTKTVYISVKSETKPHHKMSKEELMEHHSSKELHDIAENYKKSHDDVKTSVEKNGAADDSFKSQNAQHKRSDVSASEQYYMHIKNAAYDKEKAEGKAAEKATKEVNKPVKIEKSFDTDIEKAFDSLGISIFDKISVILNGDTFFKGEDDDLNDFLEKAKKDFNKLTQRRVIDKNGVGRIVWVRTGSDGKETDFETGHKVAFEHNGEKKTGVIKNMKHSKDDQYGTAEVHDEQGNKYSKSLLTLDHHKDDKKSSNEKSKKKIDKKEVENKEIGEDENDDRYKDSSLKEVLWIAKTQTDTPDSRVAEQEAIRRAHKISGEPVKSLSSAIAIFDNDFKEQKKKLKKLQPGKDILTVKVNGRTRVGTVRNVDFVDDNTVEVSILRKDSTRILLSFEKNGDYNPEISKVEKVKAEKPKNDKDGKPPVLAKYDPDDFSWYSAGNGAKEVNYDYEGVRYTGTISGGLVEKVLDKWVDGKSAKHEDVANMVKHLYADKNDVKKAFDILGVDIFEK
jgi:hypothetical protein